MKTLYMIRHSTTAANERRLYYGATDIPLSEAGRNLCLEQRGSYTLPENIRFATSGMLRTEETLQLLFGDVPHETYPALREMNQGEFEMHSYDELKDNPNYQTWLNDIHVGSFKIPGGESNLEFFKRVNDCVDELAASSIESLFVVCHGGVMASVMFTHFPEDNASFYDWVRPNCHGYAIHFEDSKAVRWELI